MGEKRRCLSHGPALVARCGHLQVVRRRSGAQTRLPGDTARRDPLPRRRERLRQIHADQGHFRRLSAGFRLYRVCRQALWQDHAARRHRQRHTGHLSGFSIFPQPHGHGKPRFQHRACRRPQIRQPQAHAQDRRGGHRQDQLRCGAGSPGRHALRRRKADGRHQPRLDVQRAPDHHG